MPKLFQINDELFHLAWSQQNFFVKAITVSCTPDATVIVSPLGEVLVGPLYGEEGILTAEVDLDELVRSRMDFDVTGHYIRDDIFDFKVKGQPEIKPI